MKFVTGGRCISSLSAAHTTQSSIFLLMAVIMEALVLVPVGGVIVCMCMCMCMCYCVYVLLCVCVIVCMCYCVYVLLCVYVLVYMY
jgi:hypothetical protein